MLQEVAHPINFRNNRGKHEIYRDILRCCNKGGESTSHIMSSCCLSWLQFNRVMPFLLRKNFIEIHEAESSDANGHMRKTVLYQTRKDGVALLMALENIDSILGADSLCIVPRIIKR